MGDFNINLLECESPYTTNDFVNTLSSHLFHSHILQPTKNIIYHSAILIDNIFFRAFYYKWLKIFKNGYDLKKKYSYITNVL